jgi:hypothetical protein
VQGSSRGGGGKLEKEKARTPAWTDRILWRSAAPGGGMQQLTYAAAEGVMVSDHRPVSAAFFVQAREYVRDQVGLACTIFSGWGIFMAPSSYLHPKLLSTDVAGGGGATRVARARQH